MALAWVSNATASDITGTAVTGSLGTTVAKQLIVITISDDSAGATSVTSVTDTFGNTWTKVPITQGTSSVLLNSSSTQMWYAVLATGKAGASHTVTVNWNTAATGRVTVAASYFNGFTGVATLDKFLGATGTSTAASSGASAATTAAAEIVVGGFGHASTTSAFSLGTGYTNLATQNIANAAVAQESKVVAATGAQTAAATIAASRAWGAIVATFKDVAVSTVSITKGLQYTVKSTPSAKTKSLKYTTKVVPTAITKGLQYVIPGPMTNLSDNFDDNSFDTAKWVNWGGSQVTESSQQINISSTLSANYYGMYSLQRYSLIGVYAFSQIVNAGNQSLTSWEVYPLNITGPDDNTGVHILIAANLIFCRKKLSGVTTQIGTSLSYNSAVHKYFRIREASGTVYFDYSTDGSTWTNMQSVLVSALTGMTVTNVKAEMMIGTWQAEASTSTAQFDNFNIIPVTTTNITKALKYTIIKSIAPTKSLKYTVKTTGTAITKATKYTVKTVVSATKSLKYTVIKSVGLTKSLKYTTKTSPTALTRSARYAVNKTTSVTKSLKYTVKAPVAITKTLKYTIKRTPAAVTKSARYAVKTVTAFAYQLKYTVKTTPAAKTKALKYEIKTAASLTKSLKYTIKTSVAKTKTLQYNTPAAVTDITKALKYTIKAPVAKTKALKYTVVKTASALTKSVKYTIKKPLVLTKSLKYTVLKGVPLTKNLKYTVKKTISVTKPIRYTILNAHALAFAYQQKYTIRTTPSAKTKALTYRIKRPLAITKSLRYTVPHTAAAVTKAVKYTILAAKLKQLAAKYEVQTHASLSKQARYAIATPNDHTLSLHYVIGTKPTPGSPVDLEQQPRGLYLDNGLHMVAAGQGTVSVQLDGIADDVLAFDQKSNSIMLQ